MSLQLDATITPRSDCFCLRAVPPKENCLALRKIESHYSTGILWLPDGRHMILRSYDEEGMRTAYTQDSWKKISEQASTLIQDQKDFVGFKVDKGGLHIRTETERTTLETSVEDFRKAIAALPAIHDTAKRWPLYNGPITRQQCAKALSDLKGGTLLRSTLELMLNVQQAKSARDDATFFYYQILSGDNIDINNVKLAHPDIALANEKPKKGIFFLPLFIDKHVVTLAVDFSKKEIYFYDSEGKGLDHYAKAKELADALKTKYGISKALVDNKEKGHQKDDHNCGRYTLEFIRSLAKKQDYKAFLEREISADQLQERTAQLHDEIALELNGPSL